MTDKAIKLLKAAVAEAKCKADLSAEQAIDIGEPSRKYFLNDSKEWAKAANEILALL